jgi:hypothetical protein
LSADHIDKVASANRGKKRSPEVKARIGKANSGKIPSVQAREKMRLAKLGKPNASVKASWARPEVQMAHREAAVKTWADPDVRAKRSAALKAAWVRRRAAKKG